MPRSAVSRVTNPRITRISDCSPTAGTDKTVPISVDKVAYINLIVGLEGTLTDELDNTYIDYSTFSYDRESVYLDMTAEVLILQDGVYVPTTVNIYDAVFSS